MRSEWEVRKQRQQIDRALGRSWVVRRRKARIQKGSHLFEVGGLLNAYRLMRNHQ